MPDPLTEVVTAALKDGKAVVLSGNAGDGKSHLAQRALDALPSRSCIDISSSGATPGAIASDTVVFVRDVSALSDEQTLAAVEAATSAGAPLLITINEGPLDSLSRHPDGGYFREVRKVLHGRALGLDLPDPPGLLVLTLAGRQLARSSFVDGALERLLPVVGPCPVCGKARDCPRVVGARMLKRSKRARQRLALLLQLLTNRGRHLSAREIWVFLIDLFFGWTCPLESDPVARADGLFWMRLFDSDAPVTREVAAEFDPVNAAMPRQDVLLWRGRFDDLDYDAEFPGVSPSALARDSREDGIRAFASAKRALFFFSKSLDAEALLATQSLAPQFGGLLTRASSDPRPVIREIVGLINRYRLAARTETDLWISRHHSFAAHKRPSALAAAYKLPIDGLEIKIPYLSDAQRYPEAGFFPDRLLLNWVGSDQVLTVSFETWQRLGEQRTLTVDRDQESLDFALDLFMSQAKVPAVEDPEVLVYDHERRETTIMRIKPDARRIEPL